MSDYRRWTSEEEQYIRDHWKTQSDAEMATALKRMEGAVRNRRRELRCSPQKTWTPEEERYLEDHWGTVSIPGIAKKLERTVSAIKVRAERLGLGGVLDSGDYVTFNQLMLALTDNAQSYSYQMESWVRRRGFPIHTKRVDMSLHFVGSLIRLNENPLMSSKPVTAKYLIRIRNWMPKMNCGMRCALE